MNIYEIDQSITALIDPETGEIKDFDVFAELQMEREAKIENMALWIKNLVAEAGAIKAEKDALYEREKTAKNKAERLKNYLSKILNGEKYSTPRVAISFRKSESVDVDEGFAQWAKTNADHLLKYKEPEADKAAIKEAIKNGASVEFARLEQKTNIQIK